MVLNHYRGLFSKYPGEVNKKTSDTEGVGPFVTKPKTILIRPLTKALNLKY